MGLLGLDPVSTEQQAYLAAFVRRHNSHYAQENSFGLVSKKRRMNYYS